MFTDWDDIPVKGANRAAKRAAKRAKALPTSWSDLPKEETSSWKDAGRGSQARSLNNRRIARAQKRAMIDGLTDVEIG